MPSRASWHLCSGSRRPRLSGWVRRGDRLQLYRWLRYLGGLAFFSNPANTGADAPWYIMIGGKSIYWQALLATKPRRVSERGELTLRYGIDEASRKAWTQGERAAGPKE